jgi:hypothetical protein
VSKFKNFDILRHKRGTKTFIVTCVRETYVLYEFKIDSLNATGKSRKVKVL